MTRCATTPRVMLWVQHLVGIGHQRRLSAIARALAERGADVVFANGGAREPDVDPRRITVVALPAARAADASYRTLVDEDGRAVDDAWRAARRDLLLGAFAEHAPHVLVTETYPFGRRMLRFELEPLVERARAVGCRVVSSIRDVLQPPSKRSRARDAVDRVLACYEAILVHGDPAFIRLEASFPEAGRIRERIRYTGYVVAGEGPSAPPGAGEGEIVVSAGGGAVAHRLVDVAIDCARRDPGLQWRLLVGPNAGHEALSRWRGMASANAIVEPNRADFVSLLARARVSVSQAGYNTVAELLCAGARAVLVPFSAAGEREQSIRAEVLAGAGVAQVIDENLLTAEVLRDAIRRADTSPAPPRRQVRLDGAGDSADAILAITRSVIGAGRR